MKQFILIANPENRRAKYFEEAVKSEGFTAPLVLAYSDLLSGKINLEATLPYRGFLRIESPGENHQVAQQLLALGATAKLRARAMHCSAESALNQQLEHGRIAYLEQHHQGFLAFLAKIEKALETRPNLKLMNSLEAIRLCFDKAACHQRLVAEKVSVPPAIYEVVDFEDLELKMQGKGWSRVFIKPLHGSSASGVLAYRKQGKRVQLISSLELERRGKDTYFFNSLRIRKYEQLEDIREIIDFITAEGVIVEQWMPKASLEGGVFDLRILVIGGKAMHRVIRQSESPMTNLHLGNQRGDFQAFLDLVGPKKWEEMQKLAEDAVAALPPMTYAAVDLMIDKRLKQAYILEVNAFGDLIPNVFVDGLDSYSATLKNLMILL
jgi:glutathione synthase/RimK-type ligase-like ATP-grasp enzyme